MPFACIGEPEIDAVARFLLAARSTSSAKSRFRDSINDDKGKGGSRMSRTTREFGSPLWTRHSENGGDKFSLRCNSCLYWECVANASDIQDEPGILVCCG